MSETTKDKYTLETLLPLNVSYDREHILRQQDVDMVNRLVEAIEGSRSVTTPKIGDRMRHVNRHGDFYGYALLERFRRGKMSVCLRHDVPFVGIDKPDIWIDASGGPFKSIAPGDMKFTGWEDGRFNAWGHCGPCENGTVSFTAKVPKWEYIEPDPLYGDFTTETWRKLYIRKDSSPDSCYLYKGDYIAFRDDAELDIFKEDYEATVFPGNRENRFVVWCFRKKTEFLPEDEWNNLDLPVKERMCNERITKVKVGKDMERHVTTIYRIKLPPIIYNFSKQ